MTPVIDRLMAKVKKDENGCWVFQGARSKAGYGYIGMGGKADGTAPTHRVTYLHFKGPIPESLVLDHLCRNRACCNPEHLEPVTRKENTRRGLRGPGWGERDITHCKRGHEFTPENTYRSKVGRVCRACKLARDAERYAAANRKEAA